jgi:hypothetical protein
MQDCPEPPTGFSGLAEAATTAHELEIDATCQQSRWIRIGLQGGRRLGGNSVASFASPFFKLNRNTGPT